jgi:hypothetical protein
MTIQERKKAIEELRAANEALRSAAKKEERGLTADELVTISNNVAEITRHNEEIAVSEAELRAKRPAPATKPSLSKMIVEARDRADKTIILGEKRDITAAGGGGTIGTDVYDLVPQIRENMVITQAGARVLSGLKGNLKLPYVAGVTAEWLNEKAAGTASGEIEYTELRPKRICTIVDVSNQVLAQSNATIDAAIEQDIVNSIAVEVQKKALTAIVPGTDANHMAQENFYTFDSEGFSMGSELGDKAVLVDDSWSVIAHPKIINMAKKAEIALQANGMIWSDGQINGYKTYRATVEHERGEPAITFAKWSECFVGFFGGIEVKVDPYTQAANGMTRLVVNAYVDAQFRQPLHAGQGVVVNAGGPV